MASIKVKFRPSSIEGKKGVIYYQVIQNRVIRQLKTNYHINVDEWDESSFSIIIKDDERKEKLTQIKKDIEWDLKRLNAIVHLLSEQKHDYSADEVINFFQTRAKELSLFDFMQMQIQMQQQNNKPRTAETYTTTLYSIGRFLNHQDILMEEINSDLLMAYEKDLQNHGVTKNSTSFYMRILRAIYNRSVDKGIIEQHFPFKYVYTGVDKTVRHAITMEKIKLIKGFDYSTQPILDFARDMFLFSFYTRGMSFIDMAYLLKEDLKDDTLVYRRRKTGQTLYIKWEPCMQEIIDKHPTDPESPYLLCILKNTHDNDRNQYKNALFLINKTLKQIAVEADISFPLTMNVARHSWASIANNKNIDISIISEGMGHDSEQATLLYLASLDNTLVNKANSQILDELD